MSVTNVNANNERYVREQDDREQERREVSIQTPETSSPSESIFNLNDYYAKGYKKDEQNEEEAQLMQEDMLEIYDISSSDENRDEKLLRVYEQILEDDNNSYLYDYCTSNGIATTYDGGDVQEFIDGVSTAMAHMSHDGSSNGDNITLSQVDFSGITSDTVSGSIEATITDSGKDYVVRGANNEVLKVVSYETAENGLTTVSVYSDESKTELIKSETAYRFDKGDGEVKYKFGSGKGNTVDIQENGNSLTINVSKGVLNAEYHAEINPDGTYTMNGKQYFTQEELALELNSKDIPSPSDLDGVIGASEQGKVGDCGLVTGINSLAMSEYGREAIKNAISVDGNGNITVTFSAIGESYTVTPDEMNKSKFSTGDPDVRAIEIAYEKMMQDVESEKLVQNDYPPYYIFGTNETDYNSKHGLELSTGTYPSAIYYMLTGIKCSKYAYQSDAGRYETLDRIENEGTAGMSVAYLPPRTTGQTNMAIQNTTQQITDVFGNSVKIYNYHHYAVKESDTLANGERVVTLINPWNSTEEIVVNQDTLQSTFNATFDIDYTLEAGQHKYYTRA